MSDEAAKKIALQLYPIDYEYAGDKRFKIDNNAGKRAVAETVAKHFIENREGCVHNEMLGLCDQCAEQVGTI